MLPNKCQTAIGGVHARRGLEKMLNCPYIQLLKVETDQELECKGWNSLTAPITFEMGVDRR